MQFCLDDIPVPAVFAEHRIIRACNAGFADLFRYTAADVIGLSFRRLYPDVSDFVRVGEQWRARLATGITYSDERVMLRSDGSRVWCRVRGRSQTPSDPLGAVLYCFEVMQRTIAPGEHMLTWRQRQILTLVASGLTNIEIGSELHLSSRTVEAHRARLMLAVGVRNAAELMAWFNANEA